VIFNCRPTSRKITLVDGWRGGGVDDDAWREHIHRAQERCRSNWPAAARRTRLLLLHCLPSGRRPRTMSLSCTDTTTTLRRLFVVIILRRHRFLLHATTTYGSTTIIILFLLLLLLLYYALSRTEIIKSASGQLLVMTPSLSLCQSVAVILLLLLLLSSCDSTI